MSVDNLAYMAAEPEPVPMQPSHRTRTESTEECVKAWHRRASLGSDYSTSSGDSGQDATTSTGSDTTAEYLGDEPVHIPTRPDRETNRPDVERARPSLRPEPERTRPDVGAPPRTPQRRQKSLEITPRSPLSPSCGQRKDHKNIHADDNQRPLPSPTRRHSDDRRIVVPVKRAIPVLHQTDRQTTSGSTATSSAAAAAVAASGQQVRGQRSRRSDDDDSASDVSEVDSYDEDLADRCPLCGNVSMSRVVVKRLRRRGQAS